MMESNKKRILVIDGFQKVPGMVMEKLQLMDPSSSLVNDNHDLSFQVEDCFVRDAKTMKRKFDVKSVDRIKHILQTCTIHGICVLDLNNYLDEFAKYIGPILQLFVQDGGSLAFPCTEMYALEPVFQKLFKVQWVPGEYMTTTWQKVTTQPSSCNIEVISEETKEPIVTCNEIFGDDDGNKKSLATKDSFKAQCISVKNVPTHEQCYVSTEPMQMQLPSLNTTTTTTNNSATTTSQTVIDTTQEGDEQKTDAAAANVDCSVAMHEYGDGLICFIGDVHLTEPHILFTFLQKASPTVPGTLFSKLTMQEFSKVLEFKKLGNDHFQKQEYSNAIECYQQAINVFGKFRMGSNKDDQQETYATLYSNMAECYLQLKQTQDCINACTKILDTSLSGLSDSIRFKTIIRNVKAHVGDGSNIGSVSLAQLKMLQKLMDTAPKDINDKILEKYQTRISHLVMQKESKQQPKKAYRNGFAAAVST